MLVSTSDEGATHPDCMTVSVYCRPVPTTFSSVVSLSLLRCQSGV